MTTEEFRDELSRLIDDMGYNYFALTTSIVNKPGRLNTVGKFKPANSPGNAELFKNDLLPFVEKYPNRYFIYYKKTTAKNEPWDYFQYDNREDQSEEPTNPQPQIMTDDRTREEIRADRDKVAALNLELGELRAEVRNLKREIERLTEELDAAYAEAEENASATMADQTVGVMGQVAQIIPSVLDKWFSLQEEKNALMREQLNARKAQRPAYQPPQNEQNNYHEEAGY